MANYTDKINKFLADQIVAYVKLHNLHWYIKGSSFFTLHAEFEKLYDATAEVIDEVAERLLALDKAPVASLKGSLALSTISELEDKAVSTSEAVNGLLADLKQFAADSKAIISEAAQAGDDVSADIFTGYLNNYEKTIWMLNSYLSA